MSTGLARHYQRRAGLFPRAILYEPTWDRRTRAVDLHLPANHRRDIIIDSASDFPSPEDLVAAVAARLAVTGRRGIVITWVTQAGTAWGGSEIGHLVWAVGRVAMDPLGRRSCAWEKDRSLDKPCQQVPIDKIGESTSPVYYSVEGRPGNYRLAPYPHDVGATCADVWRHGKARGLELPAKPAAAAAKWDGEGWVEPPDSARRASFARDAGVSYYRPLE